MSAATPTYFFFRHSKLSLPYKDHSEMPFSVLSKLGLQELNPPIDIPFALSRLEKLASVIPLLDVGAVYTSPSKRTIDTGSLIRDKISRERNREIKCAVIPRLKEIYFDLEKLDSVFDGQRMMEERGILGVNSLVFQGMVSGIHCEPIKEAYERVGKLFEEIKTFGHGSYIFLTHDFYMRVIEIFIKRKGAPYATISLEELEATQRNVYLSGFSTDSSFETFVPITSE